MAGERVQRRLAAILAADVVGYSRLMEQDETGTLSRLKMLRSEVFDPRTTQFDGRIFKNTGDGALVEFASAVDAVQCAVEIQRELARRNADLPEAAQIILRIGISLGDVIVENDDLYGNGVNIAARMEGLAEPGAICVSANVHEHIGNALDVCFEDLGEQTVKNIDRPVRCYRVHLEAIGAPAAPERQPGRALPLPDKPSIAVLPFDNMSADPEQEYFSDGMTEDIITALSRIRQLFVIARNTTFTYKNQSVDVQAVARDLGVRYVLEGGVRKAGNRVRITAQLIDGVSGNHLWAERYDRELEDIFAVQDEITETIVGAIEPQLHVAEIIRAQHKTPSSLDAWDLVMQALDRISRFTETDSREAIALLDRAIEADPTFARAHAHKGWATVWRAFQGWDPMGPAINSAGDSIAKAAQFDAEEPWVHVARTMLCLASRKGPEAIAAARKSIELNPNFAYGYSFLGVALAVTGDGDAGLAAIARAVRLSPRDLLRDEFDLFYSAAYFQKGDYGKASEHAAEAASLRPGHAFAHMMEAASRALDGDQERAEAALGRLNSLVPGFNLEAAEIQNAYMRDDDRARFMSGLRQAGLAL